MVLFEKVLSKHQLSVDSVFFRLIPVLQVCSFFGLSLGWQSPLCRIVTVSGHSPRLWSLCFTSSGNLRLSEKKPGVGTRKTCQAPECCTIWIFGKGFCNKPGCTKLLSTLFSTWSHADWTVQINQWWGGIHETISKGARCNEHSAIECERSCDGNFQIHTLMARRIVIGCQVWWVLDSTKGGNGRWMHFLRWGSQFIQFVVATFEAWIFARWEFLTRCSLGKTSCMAEIPDISQLGGCLCCPFPQHWWLSMMNHSLTYHGAGRITSATQLVTPSRRTGTGWWVLMGCIWRIF